MIPYGRQEITDEDIDAVVEVLRSAFLTQGSALPEFEDDVCKYTGAKHAIAVNSGTSALHLACRAINLGPNDWLWTSAITFASSANCGLLCGAKVDFVDIDHDDWNLSVEKFETKLILAEKENKLPKVLVLVHFCGLPANLLEINRLCKKYNVYLIEDAAHALGASYGNSKIGDCSFSDIAILSFHPVKSITTAEGGIVLTNNDEFAKKIKLLRSHGITREINEMSRKPDGPWFNEQIDLGYNYRMTEIQAALGSSQLKRLDSYIALRNNKAEIYRSELEDLPLKFQRINEGCYSSMHLFVIRLQREKIKNTHIEIFNSLIASGIGVNLHYMPVYKHGYFKNMKFIDNDFNESEDYYKEAITIPMYPTLKDSDQLFVIDKIREITN
jgi:UDP-4-amino-4,6-dideoxy-N-acetyl-beta-L-altrosamine transaminase